MENLAGQPAETGGGRQVAGDAKQDTWQRRAGFLVFDIRYSPAAEDHLRALTSRQRTTVFEAVERQLRHQPSMETRNRKPMRPNPVAPWELRVGNLRVYYDVEAAPLRVVTILAIGKKDRNRVILGGEEVQL